MGAWEKAKQHFYQKGFEEGRDYECKETGAGKCAEFGEECKCPSGLVYLARKFHASKTQETTFNNALQWSFGMIKPIAGKVMCDTSLIQDPLGADTDKVCFCEPEAPQPPKRCGGEGDMCTCRGAVFYGARQLPPSKSGLRNNFDGLRKQPYAVKYFDDSAGEVECTSKAFGEDPLPGVSKECWCDSHKTVDKKTVELDKEEFRLKAEAKKMEA